MSRPTNEEIFAKKVDIIRDNCEYEVSYRAMKIYKYKYEYYKDYSIDETELSKNFNTGYIGSCKLCSNNIVLTADILTSIRTLYKKLGGNKEEVVSGNNVRGEDIKKFILNEKFMTNEVKFPEELKNYIKAFAIVYYWSGNMMPVISNFKGALTDNWVYKMEVLKDYNKKGSHQDLREWIIQQWGSDFEKFVKENYLVDCFSKVDKEDSVVNQQINSLKKENVDILTEYNYALAKQLLLNHVKLIIQRSYRIENQFKGEWSGTTHEKCVKDIIKTIFSEAGFSEDKIDITLFWVVALKRPIVTLNKNDSIENNIEKAKEQTEEYFATHENVSENIKEFIRENIDDWDSVENIKYMLGNVFDVHIIN